MTFFSKEQIAELRKDIEDTKTRDTDEHTNLVMFMLEGLVDEAERMGKEKGENAS